MNSNFASTPRVPRLNQITSTQIDAIFYKSTKFISGGGTCDLSGQIISETEADDQAYSEVGLKISKPRTYQFVLT